MNEYSPLSISAVWLFHQLPLMGFGPFERVGVCNGGCNQCTNILSTGDESRSKHHCLLERSLSINLFVYCLFSCCVPPLSTDIESCGSRKKKKQHTRLHFNRGTSSSFLDLKQPTVRSRKDCKVCVQAKKENTVLRYSIGLASIFSNRLTKEIYFTQFLLLWLLVV